MVIKSVQSRIRIASLLAITAFLALAAAGCGQRTDKISDINDNPAKYLHRSVVVAGYVVQTFELPLGITNLAAYRIDDGTGRIWVISHDGAPADGVKVGVKGVLQPVAVMNLGPLGNPFGNVIQESGRDEVQ